MSDLKQQFEKYIHEALVSLAERAKKLSDQIECNVDSRFMDDSIDEYYIEFDASERPIYYSKLGNTGLEEWMHIPDNIRSPFPVIPVHSFCNL